MQPHKIEGIPGEAIGIAGGDSNSFAFTKEGEAFGWGWNSFGQLGDGSNAERYNPKKIIGIPGKVVRLSVGFSHILALTSDGAVYGWGANTDNQLGDGSRKPRNVPPKDRTYSHKVVDIGAGESHSLVLTDKGEIFGWGYSFEGELGKVYSDSIAFPIKIVNKNLYFAKSAFGPGGIVVGFLKTEQALRER